MAQSYNIVDALCESLTKYSHWENLRFKVIVRAYSMVTEITDFRFQATFWLKGNATVLRKHVCISKKEFVDVPMEVLDKLKDKLDELIELADCIRDNKDYVGISFGGFNYLPMEGGEEDGE